MTDKCRKNDAFPLSLTVTIILVLIDENQSNFHADIRENDFDKSAPSDL